MAAILIHNRDDALKCKLRLRAAQHGRSVEEEAQCILSAVLTATPVHDESGAGLVTEETNIARDHDIARGLAKIHAEEARQVEPAQTHAAADQMAAEYRRAEEELPECIYDEFETKLSRTKAAEPTNLFDAIRRRIAPLGGVDLDLLPRGPTRDPPLFEQ
jgi:plasmid stability protein